MAQDVCFTVCILPYTYLFLCTPSQAQLIASVLATDVELAGSPDFFDQTAAEPRPRVGEVDDVLTDHLSGIIAAHPTLLSQVFLRMQVISPMLLEQVVAILPFTQRMFWEGYNDRPKDRKSVKADWRKGLHQQAIVRTRGAFGAYAAATFMPSLFFWPVDGHRIDALGGDTAQACHMGIAHQTVLEGREVRAELMAAQLVRRERELEALAMSERQEGDMLKDERCRLEEEVREYRAASRDARAHAERVGAASRDVVEQGVAGMQDMAQKMESLRTEWGALQTQVDEKRRELNRVEGEVEAKCRELDAMMLADAGFMAGLDDAGSADWVLP